MQELDKDFHYRQAITELTKYNDRQFAKAVSRTVAVGVFFASLYFYLLG